jgi:nicotinamidase/pyrazinamidase
MAEQESSRSALLIVDLQNDFCRGGALEVPDSDRVVTRIGEYLRDAIDLGLPIYASRDWHPTASRHFSKFGGEWPVHCVQHTHGAAFHERLQLPSSATVISKGQDVDSQGYSALDGVTDRGRSFLTDLRERNIDHLYVGGLATDYCVKHSVLDACRLGLRVTVLEDAIAAVDVGPGDGALALKEMRDAGAEVVPEANLKADARA